MTKRFGSYKEQQAAFARMSGKGTNAFNRDASVRAANTLPNTPSNRKEWANNTRRIDLEGIDTPISKELPKKPVESEYNQIVENGRVIFQPTEKQTEKWEKVQSRPSPTDDEFKEMWKKAHKDNVKGWGIGKRDWITQNLTMSKEYQTGMWQGRVDALNSLEYSNERKDKGYNVGYNVGFSEYKSNRRGWDDKTKGIFDKKYFKITTKGKTINNKKDNSSLSENKRQGKTTMQKIDEIKNEINKLENEWETTRNERSEYMSEYRVNGGTDVYQDKKYLEFDTKMNDIRETKQNLEFKHRMMKSDEKKERTIDKNLDFTTQFGNDLLEVSNRNDYESTSKKLGVPVESDNEIRKDYGLKFAEYNAGEWGNKTREQRVRQVLGRQYQQILEKQDAEKRKNDPEAKKANARFIENQRKADKFHHELDNDIY